MIRPGKAPFGIPLRFQQARLYGNFIAWQIKLVKSIFTFCFLLSFGCVKAQQVKPQLHLALGKSYYLQSTSTTTSLQSVRGAENKIRTAISYHITLKVTAMTDSLYNLEGHYDSLEMNIRLPDTTLEMSSGSGKKNDTPSVIMARIVNMPFLVKMALNGKVRSIENLDKTIFTALSDFPPLDSIKKLKVAAQFTQAFGEASLKGVLEMGVAVFPGRPVAKNDRWGQTATIFSPAFASVHSTCRLIDSTSDSYFTRSEGSITAGSDTKPGELNGMPVKYDLYGSLLNETTIDKSTGWIREVKLKQVIVENVVIPDNPKIPGGTTIPMMFNTEITITGK